MPSGESRSNKPKRPTKVDNNEDVEMNGIGTSSNIKENHLNGEEEKPFSFLAMMGRTTQVNDDSNLQVKTEDGNISLYRESENGSKFSPVFFVDENTQFVRSSVNSFCRKNSKEELYFNFNKNRGAVINFYKNEKKTAMRNQRNRQKELTDGKIKRKESEEQN
ncbi:hypothetical protein ACQ4LE_005095 [Meloidogyne hapla]|uniref:Uncharacterized protein n=1 Tax=Meloidogyne hapla TaxID=6305 RepID=A0A1I8BAH5_MELHA